MKFLNNSRVATRRDRFFRELVLAWVPVIVLLCMPVWNSGAAPFRDLRVSYTQPDGASIEVIGSGDEFYAEFETDEGFTVVYDQGLKAYCFASLAPDGQLVSTGKPVHLAKPEALGVAKHLRMSKAARQQQVSSRFQRWEAGMQIEKEWEERKAALREYETQRKANGPESSPPPFTTTGVKIGLTLLIDFDDDPSTIPQAEIVNFCNSDTYSGFSNNGSVKKYYQDVSNGLLTYSNVVTVYIRIPNSLHPKNWYNNTALECGDQGNLLVRDALDIMKALPNYDSAILPTFANLTTDSNNRVVACNVFYAGGNGGVWNYGLWPHSWSLYNVGQQELSVGGKKVWKYQITNIGASLALGTFCHENGHMLCGFPDVYDYDSDSKGGAGRFCLMNSGGSGGNPTQVCAYLKRAAGWATTLNLDSTSAITASLTAVPGANFNRFYRYQKPGVATEYFLLEARYATGRDASLPASGVAIWHIDELGNHNNQSLIPNTSHQNYEVTLVQADNQWHFQGNVNSGDANDLYSSQNAAAGYLNDFSDGSLPNAQWWDGSASGASFHDFSSRATTMTFVVGYTNMAPEILAEPLSQSVIAYRSATFSVSARGTSPLSYQWYFDGSPISGATGNSYRIASVEPLNEGDYRVTVSNLLDTATSLTAHLTVLPGINLAEALDTTALTWTTGGNVSWESETDDTHDGVDAAQSGSIGDSQESWVETTITDGPGTLSFWWKVSSEASYDWLEFSIDGVRQSGRISGASNWQQMTTNILSGAHVLRWRYTKDGSVINGLDRAWLDQVSFVPAGSSAPIILTQPQNQTVVRGSTATFTVVATGSPPLSYQWSYNGSPIVGATASACHILNAQSANAGNYRVAVANTLGETNSDSATLTVLQGLTLPDAVDAPGLPWSTGGTAGWLAETSVTHDGVDAGQSGLISDNQESWLQTTVTSGPGTLSFWWRVSSETGWDFLEFYLDGTQVTTHISGEVAWQQRTLRIPAGVHALRWLYAKDESVSSGQDRGWVDQVNFAPDLVEPPVIASPRYVTGQFQCDIQGSAGAAYVVLGSTNLVNWVPLQTNAAPFTFTDSQASEGEVRFYRARSAP